MTVQKSASCPQNYCPLNPPCTRSVGHYLYISRDDAYPVSGMAGLAGNIRLDYSPQFWNVNVKYIIRNLKEVLTGQVGQHIPDFYNLSFWYKLSILVMPVTFSSEHSGGRIRQGARVVVGIIYTTGGSGSRGRGKIKGVAYHMHTNWNSWVLHFSYYIWRSHAAPGPGCLRSAVEQEEGGSKGKKKHTENKLTVSLTG